MASVRYDGRMIVVHGIIPIKPAHRDEALTLARALSEATQAEAGCVSYEFYVGLRDPNTLILLQEWKSSAALANHFRTDHVREFMDALPQMLSGKVLTRRYAVREMEAELGDDANIDGPPEPPPIIH